MCHRLVYSYISLSVSRVSLLVPIWIVDSSVYVSRLCLSSFSLSTRLRLLVCFMFLLLSRRLVSLRFSLMPLSFRIVDSSPAYLLSITRVISPFRTFVIVLIVCYIYGLEMGLLPIFNLLCNHPKGVTCEIPRTLLVLSSSLAKATALRLLGFIFCLLAYR